MRYFSLSFSRRGIPPRRAWKPLLALSCMLFAQSAFGDAQGTCRPHDFALWKRLIREQLDGEVAGGYACEILQDGKPVAASQGGYARAPWEARHPGLPFTIYKPVPLASVSKTITAVAMLRLWDEKKGGFSLDAPFWPYVASIAPHPDPAVKKITIRQVLRHQSGFAKTPDVTTHRQLAALLARPLVRKPGTKFDYLDNNYYVARVVLEQIAREPYPRYVQEHVLRPMGILHLATRSERGAPMCGYGEPGEKKPGFQFAWDCSGWAGGAGWYGSVDEMARFMHGLRARSALSAKATRILFKDALGFDWEKPGFGKGGDWVFEDRSGAGEVHTAICCFPDGIEAAMVVNSAHDEGPLELLEDTWEKSQISSRPRAVRPVAALPALARLP